MVDGFARGGGGAVSEISGFFSHLRMPNGGEGDDSENLFQRLAMHTDQNFEFDMTDMFEGVRGARHRAPQISTYLHISPPSLPCSFSNLHWNLSRKSCLGLQPNSFPKEAIFRPKCFRISELAAINCPQGSKTLWIPVISIIGSKIPLRAPVFSLLQC